MLREDIKRLDSDIAILQNLKRQIQENFCNHPELVGEYKANTGNWDRSDDSYWVEYKCPNCDKYWTEDQSEASYRIVNGKYENVSKEGFVHRKKTKYDR